MEESEVGPASAEESKTILLLFYDFAFEIN